MAGLKVDMLEQMEGALKAAGFAGVRAVLRKVPVGCWAKGNKQKVRR